MIVKETNGAYKINEIDQKIDDKKSYHDFANLMTTVLIVFSLYTLSLIPLRSFVEHFGVSTFVDIALIGLFTIVIFIFIKKSSYSFATFGLTLTNWRKHVREATLLTLPILIFFVFLKWGLITFVPAYSHIPLFNLGAAFTDIEFTLTIFTGTVVIYIVFCFIQEFIARGGLQSAFHLLLPDGKGKTFKAILLSNLLFAVAHTHIGTVFALAAFIPGLFWGWMYARQTSIIGVSVSHILIGVWVLFILGFPEFIN